MATWTLTCLTVGPLQMNAWLLTTGTAGGEAALIDPGDEADRLLQAVDASGCRVRYLLATHGHFDHVGAAAAVQDRLDLPLRCHAADVDFIDHMPEHQAFYDLPSTAVPRYAPDLVDGLALPFGDDAIAVAHVPGHAPGHVMFAWDGHAIVGDCVFAGSVGRTDLPGGDFATLEKSIRSRIYTLPDATDLHPGHGPDTTVGRERASNPYVADRG